MRLGQVFRGHASAYIGIQLLAEYKFFFLHLGELALAGRSWNWSYYPMIWLAGRAALLSSLAHLGLVIA
ncbi:hypothetical protein BG74_09090 [Sodalis-like endosymbiont of Proechinophthirus fluctus]|nr:hypothetical protein BG74_09090 [Sodalis-like endosymbiont of Proechinophthirus fluctus]